jgi:hypothetical protein
MRGWRGRRRGQASMAREGGHHISGSAESSLANGRRIRYRCCHRGRGIPPHSPSRPRKTTLDVPRPFTRRGPFRGCPLTTHFSKDRGSSGANGGCVWQVQVILECPASRSRSVWRRPAPPGKQPHRISGGGKHRGRALPCEGRITFPAGAHSVSGAATISVMGPVKAPTRQPLPEPSGEWRILKFYYDDIRHKGLFRQLCNRVRTSDCEKAYARRECHRAPDGAQALREAESNQSLQHLLFPKEITRPLERRLLPRSLRRAIASVADCRLPQWMA